MRDYDAMMACFATKSQFLTAARELKELGLCELDYYTPHPVAELEEIDPFDEASLQKSMLVAGVFGGASALLLEYYLLAVDYPLNVGNRPPASWPAFLVPAFECLVLAAGVTGFIAFLLLCRFPRLYQPVFNIEQFEPGEAFFISVRTTDKNFDDTAVRSVFARTQSTGVYDVPH